MTLPDSRSIDTKGKGPFKESSPVEARWDHCVLLSQAPEPLKKHKRRVYSTMMGTMRARQPDRTQIKDRLRGFWKSKIGGKVCSYMHSADHAVHYKQTLSSSPFILVLMGHTIHTTKKRKRKRKLHFRLSRGIRHHDDACTYISSWHLAASRITFRTTSATTRTTRHV